MKTHAPRAQRIPALPANGATPGRRERHRLETRERLFRAALRAFTEKGFQETTVEDITNAADVGKGTFFNYFPSKDHVLAAFGEMQLGKLAAVVASARETSEPMREFLATSHIHDNHGLKDEHLLPYEGTIEWKSVLPVLPPEIPLVFELKEKPAYADPIPPAVALSAARNAFDRIERALASPEAES